ncbi:class I SAM-dependent methyltransferase [Actinomycetospora straminea]|uniref:Class I SAM-dependent methyltransferase n=1 Tax=Actinomycetospora straminea TaxID=663607 RepID=A0ABP9FCY6_9PSEU|nr:class I SAM-dependent methyltransferase [Actinomycetospora straminea]MDD7934809.1 class I SAM-dependent methyltransferase [Actinomycetospora straminea]
MSTDLPPVRAEHWETIYRERSSDELSWSQSEPATSLQLIDEIGLDTEKAVVDVGAGESALVDALLARGHRRVTVLDLSLQALARARARLDGAPGAAAVEWVVHDVLTWTPGTTFGLWHDRAVFHFLTEPADRRAYVDTAARAVAPEGFLIVATFSLDGPEKCSGLPVQRYDAAALAEQFAPSFTPVTAHTQTHRTPWDAVQPFTWLALRRRSER